MSDKHQIPADGGPLYAETDLQSFIAEPWNAVSSLAILLPAIYWAFRLKFNYREFGFIFFGIPLLFLGGLGSTLYHAFRSSSWLLYMDVVPTAILTLAVGIYFWIKILPQWWQSLFFIIPVTVLRFYLFEALPAEMAVNVGYFLTGLLIFFPVLIYLVRHNFRYFLSILTSVVFLSLSLYFREMDQRITDILPMGTHFLWHLLSGVGAFFLAKYLYLLRIEELKNQNH